MLRGISDYDCLIIGAGVAGCCLARELSRFEISVAVLEAGNDIAFATSRANSGIVHAGFDPLPGSLKASYCARGARMFGSWSQELEFDYRQNGSLVVAFSEDELTKLRILEERAHANGVVVELLNATRLQKVEPSVSKDAIAALLAPSSGICDPYGLAFAAAENAAEHGTEFHFGKQVVELRQKKRGFEAVTASGESYSCRVLINAAGVYADELNNMLSSQKLSITPVRGEYLFYDTVYGETFSHTMFQAPSVLGKGILVTPTIHGNLLIGPNAIPQKSKTAVSTSALGLEEILLRAQRTWPEASKQGLITNFAGLRAKGKSGDFVVGEAPDVPGFYNIACFESPGLTAAPAVAVDMAEQIARALSASKRMGFSPRRARSGRRLFSSMSEDEQAAAIQKEPCHGKIICRCCNVSLADITYELEHGILPVLCLDALKWRTGIMMGRCHGGFCAPELVRIVHEYTGLKPEEMDKRLPHSPYVVASSEEYARLAASAKCSLSDADDGGESRDDTDTSSPATTGETIPSPDNEESYSVASLRHAGKTCSVHGTGLSAAVPRAGLSTAPPRAALPYDVVVVGAGAAGIAAAAAAYKDGAERVALLDREGFPGGILRQCIHNGFGLTRFKRELTGPEYAEREIHELLNSTIEVFLDTSALALKSHDAGNELYHVVQAVNKTGSLSFRSRTVILATGSRERGQGALNMAGSRPSGVFSAGSAQALINLEGCLPGNKVVIQGSGDIGLIMARRCLFAGADVLGVFARSSKPSGLRRNVQQCLDDYGIPFYGNRVATRLEGEGRLKAVWISRVDPSTKQVIEGSEERWEADTLLLSIGLLPEDELALRAGAKLDPHSQKPLVDAWLETSKPGIFLCGNALHIHDLADHASQEGERAGRRAAERARASHASLSGSSPSSSSPSGSSPSSSSLSGSSLSRSNASTPVASDTGVSVHVTSETGVSDHVASEAGVSNLLASDPAEKRGSPDKPSLYTEAASSQEESAQHEAHEPGKEPDLELICVRCPKGCTLSVFLADDGTIASVTGEGCKLGLEYAAEEVAAPKRIVTASITVRGSLEPLSVKTAAPVARETVFSVLAEARALKLCAPISAGTVLVQDIANTGVALVATKTI